MACVVLWGVCNSMADGSPYKGKGETVYATEPIEKQPKEPTVESDEPKYKDKEWLYHQYKVLKKTQAEIAESCGVDTTTIWYWLDKHGIKTRPGPQTPHGELKNEDWLEREYIKRGKSGPEIADMVGCCKDSVYRALDRFNIDRRSQSESWRVKTDGKKFRDHEWLFEQIVIKCRTLADIGDECGVSDNTILREQKRAGIPSNTQCEVKNRKAFVEKSIPKKEGESRNLVGDDLSIDASWRYFDERRVKGEWVPYKDAEWLIEKYKSEKMTGGEIASLCRNMGCDVTPATIYKHLRKFGVEVAERNEFDILTGEDNPQSKLSVDEVRRLREQYANSDSTCKDLSGGYDISTSQVKRIVRGDAWPDAPGPIKGEDYE